MARTPDSKTFIKLACSGCGITFERNLRFHKKAIAKGFKTFSCKPGCRPKTPTRKCAACDNITTNPKYCSSSCAAKVNGSLFPKKTKYRRPRICRICDASFFCSPTHKVFKLCQACLPQWRDGSINKNTRLGAFLRAPSVKNKHPSWKSAYVRMFNRIWNKHMLHLPCRKCSYFKHVELCHVRDITSFPLSTPVGIVNAESNIIQLCRNCHWEFDHGMFTIEEYALVGLLGNDPGTTS